MSKSPKPKRRKDLRPSELVASALDAFAENGFARTTVEDIAARAGAAKGTVYRYFDSKEALFEAAIRENIGPVFAEMHQQAERSDLSATELLTRVLRAMYKQLVDHPERRVILKVLVAEGDRFPQLVRFYHQEVLSGAMQMLGHILERGLESGEFRRSPAIEHPQVVVGPAIAALIWTITFDKVAPLDLEQYAQAHADLVLHGLLQQSD